MRAPLPGQSAVWTAAAQSAHALLQNLILTCNDAAANVIMLHGQATYCAASWGVVVPLE